MDAPRVRFYRFMGWAERYLKTDLKYLISGSFWLGLVQVAGMLSSFILAVAFAHFVSKNTFGTYKYVLSVATLISAFAYSGLSTSIVQRAAAGSPDVLRKGYLQYIRGSALIVLLSFGAALYYAILGNLVLGASFALAGIFLPVLGAATLYDSYLQGKRAFKTSAILSFFNTGVPAVVLVLVAIFLPHPLPIIAAYFVFNAVVDYLLYRYTRHRFPEQKAVEKAAPDRYSTHLSVMNILTVFSTQVDQVLLFHLFGSEQLAIYAYAIALPEQGKGFSKNVGSLALPKYAMHSSAPSRRHMFGRMLIMSAAIAVPTLAYIIAAPYIFDLFFPAYQSSVLYSQIFAVSLVTGSNVLPTAYLQAREDTKALYRITAVTAVFQILCIVIGGIWYGLLGVVLARVVARFFAWGYTLAIVPS